MRDGKGINFELGEFKGDKGSEWLCEVDWWCTIEVKLFNSGVCWIGIEIINCLKVVKLEFKVN